jgi:hypothetical protein
VSLADRPVAPLPGQSEAIARDAVSGHDLHVALGRVVAMRDQTINLVVTDVAELGLADADPTVVRIPQNPPEGRPARRLHRAGRLLASHGNFIWSRALPAARRGRFASGVAVAAHANACRAMALAIAILIGLPAQGATEDEEPSTPSNSRTRESLSAPPHEGLYLRAGVGPSYLRSKFDGGQGVIPNYTSKGWGLAYGARLGSTWSGFTLGFGLEERTIWAEKQLDDGRVTETRIGVVTLGPLVDWFVDPGGGFHLGVMPGIGASDGAQAAINICVWVGQDLRIKGNWWVGIEPRLLGGGGFHGSSSSVELLFVVTYNAPLRLRGSQKTNKQRAPCHRGCGDHP